MKNAIVNVRNVFLSESLAVCNSLFLVPYDSVRGSSNSAQNVIYNLLFTLYSPYDYIFIAGYIFVTIHLIIIELDLYL